MRIVTLFFLALSFAAWGQGRKIKSIEVSDTIRYASIDRPGDLYLVTRSGQIQKFDREGKLVSLYKNNPAPTLFEPRDGSRLFAFYRNERQYVYFNPSFEEAARYKIDSAFAIEPWLICSSGDYNVWILDAADWSLKKIDTRKGTVITEVNISVKPGAKKTDFIHLREYQGFLFLLDKTEGIHLYNGIGKHIRTLAGNDIRYFNFLGEEIYYLSQGTLKFLDLFSAESREMTLKAPADFILLSDERFFSIRHKTADVFEYKP